MVVDYLSSQPDWAGYQVSTKKGSGPSAHLISFFERWTFDVIVLRILLLRPCTYHPVQGRPLPLLPLIEQTLFNRLDALVIHE